MGYARFSTSALPDGAYGQHNAVMGQFKDAVLNYCSFATLISDTNPNNASGREVKLRLGDGHIVRLGVNATSSFNIDIWSVAGTSKYLGGKVYYTDVTVDMEVVYGPNSFCLAPLSNTARLIGIKDDAGHVWTSVNNISGIVPYNADVQGSISDPYIGARKSDGKYVLYPARFVVGGIIQDVKPAGNVFGGAYGLSQGIVTDGTNYYRVVDGAGLIKDV